MSCERWLVALDVDGTIIHEDETLSDRVVEAVHRARDAGHMVTLATGYRLYTKGMQDWNLDNAREVPFDELDDFVELIDSLGLHHVSYAIGWTAWLDIAPDGINKGTALERVLAVGDGRNDIEMFEWAGQFGRAVAMGQAPDEVKSIATEVTGDVQADGLAAALDALASERCDPRH